MIPSKIYTFTLPANGTYPLNVIGSYFKILSASGPVSIWGDSFGNLGTIDAGQGLRDVPFGSLQISDTTGATNTVRILVAASTFVDDRVAGNVSIIDSARSLVLADSSFWTNVYQSPVAAQYPHVAVFNPAASTKNLSVIITYMLSLSAVQVSLRTLNAAPAWVAKTPQNRNVNSAVAAQHQLWMTTNAVLQGAASNFPGTVLTANVAKDLARPRSPIVVKPGQGLVLVTDTVNTDLAAGFDVEEF